MRDQRATWRTIFILCLFTPTLLSAQSGHWEIIDPRPYNNTMLAVDMSSSLVAVAVGERGVFRQTSDGGATWSLGRISTTDDLTGVAYATPDVVVSITRAGDIFRSIDGGAAWSSISSPVTVPLVAIDFADADRGVAVGHNGTVIRTVDGGMSWEIIDGFGTGRINDIVFDPAGYGMLVGDNGMIATSADFGANWTLRPDAAARGFLHVSAAGDRWFIAGDPWLFLRSDDAGATWTAHDIIPDATDYPSAHLTLLSAHDEDTLTLGSIDNSIARAGWYRSTDGGESWHQHPFGNIGTYVRAIGTAGSSSIVVGARFVYRSSNHGYSWKENWTGVTTVYTAVEFADALYGFATSTDSKLEFNAQGQPIAGAWAAIDATTDGGHSWKTTRVFEGMNVSLRAAAYPDRLLAMAVGDSGLAVRSTDGGATWQRIDLGTKARLDNVSFVDRLHGVITGIGVLLRTEDGGISWNALERPAPFLAELATPSPQRIVAVSGVMSTGIVLHLSTDAGRSWTERKIHQDTETSFFVESIVFIDSLNGWAAGGLRPASSQGNVFNDAIYRTSDGGVTWSKQLDAVMGDARRGINDIAFADAMKAVAVGRNEKIIRTTDGGATWQEDSFRLNGSEFYCSVAYPTPGLAVVVTSQGQMLRYTEKPVSRVESGEKSADALRLTLWPNPAHSSLRVGFQLAERSDITISVVDELGQNMGLQVRETREKGEQSVEIDLGALRAGLYFVELTAGGTTRWKKIAVVR